MSRSKQQVTQNVIRYRETDPIAIVIQVVGEHCFFHVLLSTCLLRSPRRCRYNPFKKYISAYSHDFVVDNTALFNCYAANIPYINVLQIVIAPYSQILVPFPRLLQELVTALQCHYN